MQESKLLGTLIPSLPDFLPILQEMRDKYGIPEIGPDGEPIEELFLEGEPVSLEDFRQQIRDRVREAPDLLPPKVAKTLKDARAFVGKPIDAPWLEMIPGKEQDAIKRLYEMAQNMGEFTIRTYGQFEFAIADMLYVFLLTGETQEMPRDWISKVVAIENQGEPIVLAMASQVANPEVIVQQFREQYKKTFGAHRPKVTKQMVSTAYYMRLQREGKKWDFIVEEFIGREGVVLPRQRNSQRYAEIWRRAENRLRKRLQRYEKVLSVLLEDKK